MRRPCLFLLSAALAAFFLIGPGQLNVQAGTITYQLTKGNPDVSPYLGSGESYGKVEVTWSSGSANQATVTFTALSSATKGYYFLFGNGGAVGVNVNGTYSVGTISGSGGNGGSTTLSNEGEANEDGFGQFNLTTKNPDGAAKAVKVISFTLTKSSGDWTSESNVLAVNDHNALVAAHIFVFNNSEYKNGAVSTGFAAGNSDGNGIQNDVPEPASATLLGIGAVGLGGYGYRRWRGRK